MIGDTLQEADVKVLARASNQPNRSSSHTHSISHDLKIPESVPSEQRGSGEVNTIYRGTDSNGVWT